MINNTAKIKVCKKEKRKRKRDIHARQGKEKKLKEPKRRKKIYICST